MYCLLLETAGLQSEPDRRSTYAFYAFRSSIDVCKQILTIQAMLWRNSQQNFQVYSLKTICGYLTLLGKLNLFQNLFIQGKVGVANGKVGVGSDGRRLILKTLHTCTTSGTLTCYYLHATLKSTALLEIDPFEFVPLHAYCPEYEWFTGAVK